MQSSTNDDPKNKSLLGFSKGNILSLILIFFAYAWFISLQNLFLPGVNLSFLQALSSVLAFAEHFVYAVIIVMFLLVLRYLKIPLIFLLLISFLSGTVLIADSIFYAYFYTHLTFTALESGTNFTQLWGSFFDDMRGIDVANIVILLILQLPIAKLLSQPDLISFHGNTRSKYVAKIILPLVLISTAVSFQFITNENIHFNPYLRLAVEYVQTENETALQLDIDDGLTLKDFYVPMYAEEKYESDLSGLIKKTESAGKKKNIILIVLESIGGPQLFPDGKISSTVTPFLASIRDKTTLFNTIYGYYPATTRSHVPLQTGGTSLTYSTTKILKYPFNGSTLTSVLNNEDYNTALVSSQGLNFGNLDVFYKKMGFDLYFDPTYKSKAFQKENKVHTWGVFETAVLPIAMSWLDLQASSDKPFLLQFFTVSSHDPYGYPGSKKEKHELSLLERYVKSLRYADKIIKDIWQGLEDRGLLENSLVYITGDHGQAFGKRHEKNFTHRNYIYDENVVTFFMRVDNAQKKEIVINRVGSIGDIMPTILADAVGVDMENKVIGQDLFSSSYKPRLQFFHKHQLPRQWGIRDGKWKFISPQVGTEKAELYDLSVDATEKNNLANKYPERIREYQQRAARWISAMQHRFDEFTLAGSELLTLSATDLAKKGPKKLLLGINPGYLFKQQEVFHPDEDISALVYRIPDGKAYDYSFIWISPSGIKTQYSSIAKAGSERIITDLNYSTAMEQGDWKLLVQTGEGPIFTKEFQVSSDVPLRDPRLRALGPKKIDFYFRDADGELHQQATFHPKEQVIIETYGKLPFRANTLLDVTWTSPSDIKFRQTFHAIANNKKFQILFNNGYPMREGKWQVKIYNKSIFQTEATFYVDKKAALHVAKRSTQRRGKE